MNIRYIDNNKINIPKKWIDKVKIINETLINAKDYEERKKIIKDNEKLWREIKDLLIDASYGKCWYSEAKELVSDWHVDHFRPKLRARELDDSTREGYWWLAFDWTNYRLAGAICNCERKDGENEELYGKGDYFPLREGSPVACTPDCPLEDELNYLLDPTNENDPGSLSFDESGEAMPSTREGTWEFNRAKVTIDKLHLNYVALTDERRKIWSSVYLDIIFLQNYSNSENPSLVKKGQAKEKLRKIRNKLKPDSELSSTVKACIINSGDTAIINKLLVW